VAPRLESGTSDADLVRAALLGAREPFAELVTRHWETAVALATRVLGSAELARDAAQEAAVSAMTGLDRLRSPERFGAWFCGIALNVARRWLRQLRPESLGLPADDLVSDSPGPAELAEIADLAGRVRGAIATLPGGQRDAILLFYLQGLSHREVAAELRISTGAVKARLHQARAALAPRLSQLAGIQLPGIQLAGAQEDSIQEDSTQEDSTQEDSTQEGSTMTAAEAQEWVEVRVAEVRRTDDAHRPKHLMLLEARGGSQRLPIWIGPAEATAMAMSLESVEHPRPLTHSLTASLLRAAGSPIREVRITRLIPPVFYATVIVDGPDGPQEVDARPSDAVNLALVANAPIRMDSRLFSEEQTAHYAEALTYPTGTAELAAEAARRWQEDLDEVKDLHEIKDLAPGDQAGA
jgi:RNA polymerase sigma factor (sigma-70 family)